VNTAPDNFIWEKEKTSVMVTSPGLYHLTLGFFSAKKPTVQVLVNGDNIFTVVGSSTSVVNHSISKMKNTGKSLPISGVTLSEYIIVPERARIAISYTGEETGEGFFGLRKL